MKKVISLLLAVMMLFSVTAGLHLSVYADVSDFEYELDEDTGDVEIVGYSGSSAVVTIPSEMDGHPVTSIGTYAFRNCDRISDITIPDSVIKIGSSAFNGCTSLRAVAMPDTIREIGANAFANTYLYNNTSFWNDNVLYLGNALIRAKDTVNGAYSVREGTVCMADEAFKACASLTSVTLPETLFAVSASAFSGCSSLENVTMQNGLTGIGNNAFQSCTALVSATIPETVTSIGNYAYDGCAKLVNTPLPRNLTGLGSYAFRGCKTLTDITVPGGVALIGSTAFKDCTGLVSLMIEDGVGEIGSYAFDSCSKLKNISIPQSVKAIGSYAFQSCSGLQSLTVADGCKTIGMYAFYECSNLSSVTLPDSTTEIGNSAFTNTAYYRNSANWTDGVLYINHALIKAEDTLSGVYTLRDQTVCVASSAFLDVTGLTEIVMPETVREIGVSAFSGCTGLIRAALPDSVISIGATAFYHCISLCETAVPKNLQTIGASAFESCTALTVAHIPNGMISIGNDAFKNCTALSDVKIGKSIRSVGSNAFLNTAYYNDNENWEDGVLYISRVLIKAKTTTVSPYRVKDNTVCIAVNAFANCKKIAALYLPDSVKVVGNTAFSGCTKLKDIYYSGDENEWENTDIGYGNAYFINAEVHYNAYETEETVLDFSAYEAVIASLDQYPETDYSEDSYQNLMTVVDEYRNLKEDAETQDEIDQAVTDLLTAIYDLIPYLNLSVTAAGGTFTIDGENIDKKSVLFGTEIRLNAQAEEGYIFRDWYEVNTKRVMSQEAEFTFVISSNTDLQARFVKEDSAVLTFTNVTGQIVKTYSKTVTQWNEVADLGALLPKVPYRYGYHNGRWVYDETAVLSALTQGNDVTVTPEYDLLSDVLPSLSESGDEPVLLMEYHLDDTDEHNLIGSFVMAVSLPENCQVEEIGTAFLYGKAESFDPADVRVTINNKVMTSKYTDREESGIYITNINHFSSKYRWAARGYVTYYDENGTLKAAYSNQINITDMTEIQ